MKLTPWFSGKVLPVHEGVYERKSPSGRLWFSYYSKDNGWGAGTTLREKAILYHSLSSPYQDLEWRRIDKS